MNNMKGANKVGGQFPMPLDCKVFGQKEHFISYLELQQFAFCIIMGFLVLICFLHFFFFAF